MVTTEYELLQFRAGIAAALDQPEQTMIFLRKAVS